MDTKEKVKYPRVKKSSTIFFLKTLLFLLVVALIVLIRRMDQMSFRSITEEEALEMAQDIKVTLPDQEVTLMDSGKTQKLKTGKTVKVLGVYKKKLNKGNSPRVYWTNQLYLMELPDGSRAYGPLMETAIGQLNVLPEGDTAVITAVRKPRTKPSVQATGTESRFDYAYTLEGHEGQYALEDLHIYFPQRVTYLADGLREEDYLPSSDTLSDNMGFGQRLKKFFFYDIRPVTKKTGFFIFPKYQTWNEFKLQRWFRILMIFFAYLLEIWLIVFLISRWPFVIRDIKANQKNNRILRRAKRGDADACYNLGDLLESFSWYRRAANLGHGKACAKVGDAYENGRLGQEIDYLMAEAYYKRGAKLGNRNCQEGKTRIQSLLDPECDFGRCYLKAEGKIRIQSLLDPESDFGNSILVAYAIDGDGQGDSDAQYNIGLYYLKGQYVQQNGREAYKWFKKVADQNDPWGWFGLGLCYWAGKDIATDYTKALNMYNKALSLGYDNPDIYFYIGNCYNALRDFRQALTYYRKGADLGNSAAIKMLRDKGYNV